MMKHIAISLLIVLVLVGGTCFVGCETESASQNNIRINPASAIILIDESLELTASGGFDYEWSLENEAWGTLSTTIGNRTVYTSAYDPAADTWQEHQVITVTSYINKQSTNATDFSDYAQTAEAIITHQTAQVVVQISPPNATVTEFGSVTFTASGANRYSWSLQYPSWGELTATQGETTTYTSTFNPGTEHIQVMTCTTDRGTTTAHIVHDPEGIVITPSTASLNPGESVTFNATGATSVNWSYSGNGAPNITGVPSGNSYEITFTVDFVESDNPRIVTVRASSGEDEAQASVSLYGTIP
ncbi:MAG: hypothetical protein ISS31_08415 [Kiritimatiellae bacterium]|nr:hypothetical protein [Kiritimatiellia bacterium]